MYVYNYVYIIIYVFICICVCAYIYIYTYAYAYIYVCVCACLYILYIYIYMCVCAFIYLEIYTPPIHVQHRGYQIWNLSTVAANWSSRQAAQAPEPSEDSEDAKLSVRCPKFRMGFFFRWHLMEWVENGWFRCCCRNSVYSVARKGGHGWI